MSITRTVVDGVGCMLSRSRVRIRTLNRACLAAACIRLPSRQPQLPRADLISRTSLSKATFATVSSQPILAYNMTAGDFPRPPVAASRWDFTAEEITKLTKESIDRSRKTQDQVAALPHDRCTFDSVISALAHDEASMAHDTGVLEFLQNVSTDESVRKASVAADQALADFGIESSMRLDVFNAVQAADKATDRSKLDAESTRLLDRMLRDGKRAGLTLSESDREKLKALKNEISQLSIEFQNNCNQDKEFIDFTADELKGVPEDVIAGFSKSKDDSSKLRMTFKTPDYLPVIKYAQKPTARRRAFVGYESRLPMNVPIMEKTMKLRAQAAQLLGYANWAEYVLEVKMAKDVKTVNAFLDDLYKKLKPIGLKERDVLLKLKEKECKELNIPYDGKFYVWDYRYYDRLHIEQTLAFDEEEAKQYLPVAVVVPKVLELYKRLLGVELVPIDSPTWYEDVQAFATYDLRAADNENPFLGFMYTDLFPRDNKYGHAAVWGLIPGFTKEDGNRSYPTAAMVANLAKPSGNKVTLISHDQSVTLCHEFGHAYHQLLSKTRYSRFHGTNVARDFVEAPSQLSENFIWLKKELIELSAHYKTKKPMPDELIEKLISSRFVNSGLFNLRQLFFGLIDMKLHTRTPDDADLDYTKLWCEMRQEISLVEFDGEYAPGEGSFAHIMSGYAAGYYGYLYSLSFSADMFSQWGDEPIDKAGKRYRKSILQPGGSRDELDSLKEFLGREPSNKAFMDMLLGHQ
ncbi:uncharacterized protein L969DRAFT_43352 [Mixia osmundae IAM 14324]|uniref:Peptidase M3A/M3B catalytic domain-containing protein n=1 Tax=Mixia osmundae (strain CBS 9802 / IAM 14324 / JCM 22182 / KY 12970) TaxID=764103 RepID=G7EAJ5_MIXOS|nr:uncharacterized protein L969DRAFT_43352 [Mixia osmundae IAM 14324]KEI42345.1 hypothetical protein L969DRAFT_43352 [Mixia osmundae IAM 14324]GAA99855.1 hypothetical protein E5Q_06558 [Mixia osmundae IAM 14324]